MDLKLIWTEVYKSVVSYIPELLWKLFLVAVIILASVAITRIGRNIIARLIQRQKGFKFYGDGKRLDTLSTILGSMLIYTVYFVAAVTILTNVLNLFDINTILTAAGIGGIALGFGAQSLVRDVISGFFILAENQFAVGDVVAIGGMVGTVEEMELRVTRIRNYNGELYIIPNGEIKVVTNHTRGNRLAVVDTRIPYEIDIEKANEVVDKACKLLEQESEVLAEAPQVIGVTELRETYYVVRATAKTMGAEHWAVERELRKKIIACFEEENIKLGIAFPVGDSA